MYFTKGKRRRYERLMQTRPGLDRDEPLQDEAEKLHQRNGGAHEAGQSKRGQGTNKQGTNNHPKKES